MPRPGADCIVARMGYTGESRFELQLEPAAWGSDLDGHNGRWGLKTASRPAVRRHSRASTRNFAGYLLVGNDHDKNRNPFEAGIGRVVKFNKPDFNGRPATD